MKKEEIIALGINEEVAKQILAINGTDIENAKTKAGQATEKASQELENLKLELETTKETLVQANSQIKNFEGMDVESKDKAIKEWQTKYSELENNAKAEREANEKKLADQQYDFKANEYVNGLNFSSEWAKKAYLTELKNQGFKLSEDGSLLGAKEYTENFKKANEGVFVVEEVPTTTEEPLPEFTKQTTQNTQPIKMTLTEAMKIKNAGGNVDLSQIQ